MKRTTPGARAAWLPVLAAGLFAAACDPAPSRPESERPPRFEDFPAARWEGAPAAPDLGSHPDASRFGAALWQGARRGPNFAGRYTIVSRRCGRLCREFAIVDAVTGRVHPGLSDTPPFSFRLDSRLIRFDAPSEPSGRARCVGCEATFYVWSDPRLELIPPESWASGGPPPDRVRRFIDSVRAVERPSLAAAGPAVTRPNWDRIVFAARDGTRLVLRDQVRGGVIERLHVFRGEIRGTGSLLVEAIGGDSSRFLAIDPVSGRAAEYAGPPR